MEFCKVTLTFESADQILWCDHSNKSSTYTWCYLFCKILQNEICKLTRNLPLASFGSETVKTPSQTIICRTGPSCSKAGYHVFLDKSLANTENNKKKWLSWYLSRAQWSIWWIPLSTFLNNWCLIIFYVTGQNKFQIKIC